MATEKRRWPRTAILLLTGTIAILLVAYLALVVVLRAVVDPASLADRAEPYLSSALNRRVSVGSAALSIFPRPEVRLLRIRVENLPDFEGTPLATVDEFRLRPRLLPLLKRRVEVDRVQILGPRVLLQVDEQGKTNFGDFVPASREEDGQPQTPIFLDIRGIQVADGRVGYRDAPSGRLVQADGLWVEGAISRDTDGRLALDIESSVDSLRFAFPPAWRKGLRGLRVEVTLEAVAGPDMQWIEVDTGKLTVNGLTVDISGRADSVTSSRRILDLAVRGDRIELSRLLAALPDSVRDAVDAEVWGDMDVDLTVRGALGPDVFPSVDGIVTIRGGGFGRGGSAPLLESLDADIRLGGERAEISGVRARLPGGELSGSGEVNLDSTLAFRADIGGRAEAEALARAFRPPDARSPTVSRGSIRWNVEAEGDLTDPAATSLAGVLGLEDVALTGGQLAGEFEIPSAVIDLEGSQARWNGVTVIAAGDEMLTTGVVYDLLGMLAIGDPRAPVVEASVDGERLDLDALLGPARDEVGYGRIAWARLADRPLEGRSPEDWATERELRRPDRLPVTGRVTFRLDSLVRLPYRLSDVEGQVLIGRDRIELNDTRFAIYGGTGSARGAVQLGEVASEPFLLDISLEGVRAEQYLAQNTPLGSLISGSLTMDLSLEGGLDSLALPVTRALNGIGRFEIRDGRLASNALTDGILAFLHLESIRDLEFTRWTSPFLIQDGLIVLDGSDFSGSELVAELQGALGFGGSLNMGALVRPDSALARGAASAAGAAGEVINRYLAAGGAVELALRLTGQATNPQVELDPDAMGESTRNVLDQAAKRAVESGEEEILERGLNLLRGLAGQRNEEPADTAPGP